MTEEEKVQLTRELSVGNNFYRLFSAASGRRWFVRYVIDHFESQGLSNSDIRAETTDTLTKAKTIVNNKKDFSIGINLGRALTRRNRRRRVECLYGAIGDHPELTDPALESFLEYIVKRRYRSVIRMDYFVNPNGRGYFRYPSTCATISGYQVNDEAQSHWKQEGTNTIPIKFKSVGGSVQPVASIEKLFTRKRNPCEGNLMDCAAVLTVILMDSLFESQNEDQMLGFLVSKGLDFLSIYHPNVPPDIYFTTDTTLESLFMQGDFLIKNLQIGDHIYIYNHPLYKVFRPTGSWRGEHSLVYHFGNRDFTSRRGFTFGGHGKEGTVYQFYNDFLLELKTHLSRVYRMAKIHIDNVKNGTLPSGSVSTTDHTFTSSDGSTLDARIFEYDLQFSYTDYEHRGRRRRERKFVVTHNINANVFAVDEEKNTADVIARANFQNQITIQREHPATSPADQYDHTEWKIFYKDTDGSDAFYPLFERRRGRIRLHQLEIDDLFESPFLRKSPNDEQALMTKPKIHFSSTYQSFLSTNGAI